MKFRVREADDVRVEVTPLIDIVFQLVLFFMVSTTFDDSPRIDIQLPESATQTVLQNHQNVEIWLDENGDCWIQRKRVELEDLDQHLSEALASNADMALIVQADKQAFHGRVVEILNIAQSVGIVKMSIGGKKDSAP